MSRPSLSKDIRTAITAGLAIIAIERTPDGGHKLLTRAANEGADSELERARERRNARKADRAA